MSWPTSNLNRTHSRSSADDATSSAKACSQGRVLKYGKACGTVAASGGESAERAGDWVERREIARPAGCWRRRSGCWLGGRGPKLLLPGLKARVGTHTHPLVQPSRAGDRLGVNVQVGST